MSDIQLQPLSDNEVDEWDQFVDTSNNGTLFHRLDFLSYHGNRFEQTQQHLVFRKNGNLLALLPLGVFDSDCGLVAKSPFGASFGGLVCKSGVTFAETERIFDLLCKYLVASNIMKLNIVMTPHIYQRQANDYAEYFLIRKKAQWALPDLTSYIKVSEQVDQNYLPRARRDLNKSIQAGLQINDSSDVETFYEILLENMEKFSGQPTHSRQEVNWLIKKFPERVRIFNVTHDGLTIASSLVFKCNSQVLLVFYWAQRQDAIHLHPKNFLISELAKYAMANQIRYIDFGPQTLKMEPFYGVTMFKESLGGNGLLRKSYVLSL